MSEFADWCFLPIFWKCNMIMGDLKSIGVPLYYVWDDSFALVVGDLAGRPLQKQLLVPCCKAA